MRRAEEFASSRPLDWLGSARHGYLALDCYIVNGNVWRRPDRISNCWLQFPRLEALDFCVSVDPHLKSVNLNGAGRSKSWCNVGMRWLLLPVLRVRPYIDGRAAAAAMGCDPPPVTSCLDAIPDSGQVRVVSRLLLPLFCLLCGSIHQDSARSSIGCILVVLITHTAIKICKWGATINPEPRIRPVRCSCRCRCRCHRCRRRRRRRHRRWSCCCRHGRCFWPGYSRRWKYLPISNETRLILFSLGRGY